MQRDFYFSREDLESLVPAHDSFVGVDSDGCVFDTMEVKQKGHFHPKILKHWDLYAIETNLRAAAEFVNLYSIWRGRNRFEDLLVVFDLLADWPEVQQSGVTLPDTTALRAYVNSGLPLGNRSLEEEVRRTGSPELKRLLAWSLDLNADIAENMKPIPPFEAALKSLHNIHQHSDVIVVSQTPEETLVNEWRLHNIDSYISAIAGQELGTKSEHIALATHGGRYPAERILMIGDAPGDLAAANDNDACFYPINPGREEESWERFHEEAYGRFLAGEYRGEYEQRLIDEYQALLPEVPPWK